MKITDITLVCSDTVPFTRSPFKWFHPEDWEGANWELASGSRIAQGIFRHGDLKEQGRFEAFWNGSKFLLIIGLGTGGNSCSSHETEKVWWNKCFLQTTKGCFTSARMVYIPQIHGIPQLRSPWDIWCALKVKVRKSSKLTWWVDLLWYSPWDELQW